MQWYRDRGLTLAETKVADADTMFYSAGETYTAETITQSYSCGRIDVRGIPDQPYGDEVGVPPMRSEDWHSFGSWLDDVQTASIWTLRNLVDAYENQTGQKITWDNYETNNLT